MKNKAWAALLTLIIAVSSLTSCGDNFSTPLTDDLKFTTEFSDGDVFTSPSDNVHAIGEITISEVVDGDTFNFYNGRGVDPKTTSDISYTVRLLGINTPESTARIEPWGVKASQFVKSILWDSSNNKQKPYSVVLINDVLTYGQLDGTTSERYLGFVWYKMDENSDYRLLNLELIEQCYTQNYLDAYSDYCPYYNAMIEAHRVGNNSKKRVFGEKDPDYDYTDRIEEVSIRYIKDNYVNLGVSDTDSLEASSSGVRLRITGVIVGFSGDNMFIRDVTDPDKDGNYTSIYVYTALTVIGASSTYRVGQIITFVAKATKYHNNVQLTDVKDIKTGSNDEKIRVLLDPRTFEIKAYADWSDETKVNALKAKASELGYGYDLYPLDLVDTFDEMTNLDDVGDYVGDFVKIKLTVRNGDAQDEKPTMNEKVEDYYRYDSDGYNLTYFAKTSKDLRISIRVLYYQPGYYGLNRFKVGTSYYLTGQIARYYDGYQIILPNDSNSRINSPVYGEKGYVVEVE